MACQLRRLSVLSSVASSMLASGHRPAAVAAATTRATSSSSSSSSSSSNSSAAEDTCAPPISAADFNIVARESGSKRRGLPIFTSRPGLLHFDRAWHEGLLQKGLHDLEAEKGLPGSWLLPGVLTQGECEQLIAAAETMGFTEDAPVSLGRHIRQNMNNVWIADDSLWLPIFKRVERYLPQAPAGASGTRKLAGLNQRWRLYKYGPGDVFKPHTDGDWPGSAVVDGKLHQDAFGDRWSAYTFVLYLNEDFDGGDTVFYQPKPSVDNPHVYADYDRVSVPAVAGAALVFPHGSDPRSPLHEGALVSSGTKMIIRSDVLYLNN
eukprot:COSAG05_NODE_483_length_9358_cov_36.727184_7_plen_321_part_00